MEKDKEKENNTETRKERNRDSDHIVYIYTYMYIHAHVYIDSCARVYGSLLFYGTQYRMQVGEGEGEGVIDVINATCNKQDYLLYVAY